MEFMERIYERAREEVKRIVLPEGEDPRIVEGAVRARDLGICRPILLGNPEKIRETAQRVGVELGKIPCFDPENSPLREGCAETLYDLRRNKGMTTQEAQLFSGDPEYFGCLMVKRGEADGLVSGAVHTTGNMLRPALQIIRARQGVKLVSSAFLAICPNREVGEDGVLLFSDCVVNPTPTVEELAHIGVTTARTAQDLCGIEEPRVAFLSFSTRGSARHELAQRVREAVALAHALDPKLLLDGEMQSDAALAPEVAASKAPGSMVAGRANVLIFPDLQAGNIAVKLVQRLAGAETFAVLQGLDKPCNDLSRGCSVADVVNTIALTAVQAQSE